MKSWLQEKNCLWTKLYTNSSSSLTIVYYYRKSWTENVRGSSKAFSSKNKIAAYMFGPRDDFQTWGWAMKRKLLCPPESLKIISRTKHVCQDFVLQTKKTLEDTEDIFRPRFPVVQYFINFQRGFETSHSTPFSRMNFVSVWRQSKRKREQPQLK